MKVQVSKKSIGQSPQGWEAALAQEGIEFTPRALDSECVYYEYDHRANRFSVVKLMPNSLGGVFFAMEKITEQRLVDIEKVITLLKLKRGFMDGLLTADEYAESEVLLVGHSTLADWDNLINLWTDSRTRISIGAPVLGLLLETLPQSLLHPFISALKSEIRPSFSD